MELRFPDPNEVFPDVLKSMYTGVIAVTPDNVLPLLAMADHYMVKGLKSAATDYITKNTTRDNAVDILQRAVFFGVQEVMDKCINTLAKSYFNNITPETDLSFLPLAVLLRLLQHPYLAVKEEFSLYEVVCRYIAKHSELTPVDVKSLMDHIRFRWMTFQQLAAVEANPQVPRELLLEATLARLKDHEAPPELPGVAAAVIGDPSDAQPPRLRKRPAAGLEFEYLYDFDDKGIVYFIATNGARAPWVNPHTAG